MSWLENNLEKLRAQQAEADRITADKARIEASRQAEVRNRELQLEAVKDRKRLIDREIQEQLWQQINARHYLQDIKEQVWGSQGEVDEIGDYSVKLSYAYQGLVPFGWYWDDSEGGPTTHEIKGYEPGWLSTYILISLNDLDRGGLEDNDNFFHLKAVSSVHVSHTKYPVEAEESQLVVSNGRDVGVAYERYKQLRPDSVMFGSLQDVTGAKIRLEGFLAKDCLDRVEDGDTPQKLSEKGWNDLRPQRKSKGFLGRIFS